MGIPEGYVALGIFGFTDKGDYSNTETYVKNDLVHINNDVWRCLRDDINGIAPAHGDTWSLFVRGSNHAEGIKATDANGFVGEKEAEFTVQKMMDSMTKSLMYLIEKRYIHGIRRKLNALSGSVRRLVKDIENEKLYLNCRVTTVDENYIVIYFLNDNIKKHIRFFFGESNYKYEVTRLNGCEITRSSLYTPKTVDKTIISVYIDNVKYDNIDILKQMDFSFKECVITYSAPVDSLTCVTTLVINHSGITVYETLEDSTLLVDTFVTGGLFNDVAIHGNTKFFVLNNGANHFSETVTRNDNTVVKKIVFGGGD